MKQINKDKLKEVILITIFCFFSISFGCIVGLGARDVTKSEYTTEMYSGYVYVKTLNLKYEQARANLIDEVQHYIDSIAPTSSLNALTIVNGCDKYNIDIRFVLAQGHLESHFGTRGIAAKTNSVFNVKSYDGHSANQILKSGNGYKHPDFSVEPYLQLLRNKYLVKDKTEYELMDKFIDCNGKRYASNTKYEEKLLSIYNKIDNNTNITAAYKEYNKYKILSTI